MMKTRGGMIGRNSREIKYIEEHILDMLKETHNVVQADAGIFTAIRIKKILKFCVRQYRIENSGNLSFMSMNAGIMQMISIVFTPIEKTAPIYSLDYIYVYQTEILY